MNKRRRCLSLTKGQHQYVFWYDEGRESELLAALVDYAKNEAHVFDWFDAAILSYQIGRQIDTRMDVVV